MMRLALALIIALMPCTHVWAAPISTGVSGMVSLSPARPGPQHAGESDAAPMASVTVQVRKADGQVVARTVTDAQGRFSVQVPAGQYRVEVDVQGAALPRCEIASALVHDGQLTHVRLDCDSGIR
ncbi:carboxypeptidase-like regulatory domain-containing protein [Dyella sp. Tek66A03]|uniref:carboxypeptidase-like regulatory domain-containing protein n=1 Tax=Dyella sp. Tek66A03 TaxID=3458298 RepID=UPI00403E4101